MVLESNKLFGLLGRDVIGAEVCEVNLISESSSYLPVVKGFKAHMKLKTNAQDKYCAARPVPLPYKERVANELKRLENMGVISPCKPGGVTNASPVVWIKKKDGKNLRMCADYTVHLN